MRRLLLCCLSALLLLTTTANSQTYDTTEIQGFLQHLMQPLDKNQIPTGFLEEYGLPAIGMKLFDGTSNDANWSEPNLWRLLYFQMYTSYTGAGANPLPTIQTVNSIINQNLSPGAPIPIPVLLGSYNKFREDALQQNLLSYDGYNRRLYDVPGRMQSPYTTHRLFSAVPMRNESFTGTESFVLNTGMVWGNTGLTVNNLQVDFQNDAGFITLLPNSPVQVTWADTGYYHLTIKAALSDGSTAECRAEYYVLQKAAASNPGARYASSGITTPPWGIIGATGSHSGGTVQIIYSTRSPRPGVLRKPLIIVENMDAFGVAPRLQLRPYDMNSFLLALSEPGSTFDFNEELDREAGYDLVFINFNNGVDAVERNAAMVVDALVQINAAKQPDDRAGNILQQNVVLGMGVGGLYARYALAQTTKATGGNPTQTRLLITHDAPHRGMNVALGLQHLSRMMGRVRLFGVRIIDLLSEAQQNLSYLTSPVMEQTLLYRTTSDDANVANTWLNSVYQPMVDYNSPYRFVATTLGNECARPVHNNKKFVDIGASVEAGIKAKLGLFLVEIGDKKKPKKTGVLPIPLFKHYVKFETAAFAGSIPAPAAQERKVASLKAIFKYIIFSDITVVKLGYEKTATAPTTYLPVDGVPGSVNSILGFKSLGAYEGITGNSTLDLEHKIAEAPIPYTPFSVKVYGFLSFESWNRTDYTTLYTTTPVGSALDVSPFDNGALNQKFVNGTNAAYPSKSETYIAQESVTAQNMFNNQITRFTARNARFLVNEMEGRPNLENCSSECSNPYTIEGPDGFCNSATYLVRGLPRSASVNWSVYPSGIASPQQSGNNLLLTKLADGVMDVNASIVNGCPQNGTVLTKRIGVGVPTLSQRFPKQNPRTGPIRYSNYNYATMYRIYTGGFPGAYQTWTVSTDDPYFNWGFGADNVLWFYFSNEGYTATFDGMETNPCGSSNGRIYCKSVISGGSGGGTPLRTTGNEFTISPNPASNHIRIKSVNNVAFTQVRVLNWSGVVCLQQLVGENTTAANINISSLPPGTYTVQVVFADTYSTQQFIKK